MTGCSITLVGERRNEQWQELVGIGQPLQNHPSSISREMHTFDRGTDVEGFFTRSAAQHIAPVSVLAG
jgi:hypothetical protein